MKVTVRLFGRLMERYGFSEKEVEVPEPCTAGDLVRRVGIEEAPLALSRNAEMVRPDEKLRDGDRVLIAPIFSGG